jgi:hypothetical protein
MLELHAGRRKKPRNLLAPYHAGRAEERPESPTLRRKPPRGRFSTEIAAGVMDTFLPATVRGGRAVAPVGDHSALRRHH